MSNGSSNAPIRVVVGSDNAGHAYKTALKEVLKKHSGVTQVLDVGVVDADDSTAYPHLAVDACKMIKSGEVCSVCVDLATTTSTIYREDEADLPAFLLYRPTAHFWSAALD